MKEWKGLSLSFGTSDVKRLTKVFLCHELEGAGRLVVGE